jgi:hypothetical protein
MTSPPSGTCSLGAAYRNRPAPKGQIIPLGNGQVLLRGLRGQRLITMTKGLDVTPESGSSTRSR